MESLVNHWRIVFLPLLFCETDYMEMTANSSDRKNVARMLRKKSNGKGVLEFFQNNFFFLAQDETRDLARHNFNFSIVEYQQYL